MQGLTPRWRRRAARREGAKEQSRCGVGWQRARWIAASLLLALGLDSQARADPDAQRGAVLFALAGGCGCHTPEGGPVGAGGRELPTPFGTFYGTNITSDPATGIGKWNDDEIIAAIRDGDARHKGVEAPVMPYMQYAGMMESDLRDLVAYLRTLPPVHRPNREAQVRIPFPRTAYWFWRLIFARPVAPPPEVPRPGVERGHYLANAVSICGDCHTPRDFVGALSSSMYLAGSQHGPDGNPVPNITPDRETGAGSWDISDLTQLLQSGMKPDFDNVQGLMAEVIDGRGGGLGYAKAPPEDLRSIAAYLKTIPPIPHRISRK